MQGQQGVLALLVLGDALLQLLQLPLQPGIALGRVLVQQLGAQGVGLQARSQGLLLGGQLFLLL